MYNETPDLHHLLDRGEKILWQGRPYDGFVFKPSMLFALIFCLFFVGFSVFWMSGAAQAGGFFWMFGLIHFSAGLFMLWLVLFGDIMRRKSQYYILTDKRAMIVKGARTGRQNVDSHPITKTTALNLNEGQYNSIYFAERGARFTDFALNFGSFGKTSIPVGFECIDNARDIYRKMRDIQQAVS